MQKDASFIILNSSLILIKKDFQELLNLKTGFKSSVFQFYNNFIIIT